MPIAHNRIYPCVVHENYLAEIGKGNYFACDFGHDLVVMLIEDHGTMTRSISPEELSSLGLSEDGLWDTAFENLGRSLNSGEIPFNVLGFPGGESIVIAGPHWLASMTAFQTGLHQFVAEQLNSTEIAVMVPCRENAIFFPEHCSAFLRSKVDLIGKDSALESRKPFGPRFFKYRPDGAQPTI